MSSKRFGFFIKANIKQQLYMLYLAAVFVPIAAIGVFLLFNSSKLLINYHKDLLKADNLRVKTILFEITTQVYNISEDLAFDEEIRDIVSGSYYIRSSLEKKVDLITVIDTYDDNYAEIEEIGIYTDNPAFMDYKQFHRADETVLDSDWFQKAKNYSGVFWVPVSTTDKYGNQYWNFCLVRKIHMINSNYSGVLVIKLSDNYLRTRIGSQEYRAQISADEGIVFYSSDRKNYGTVQQMPSDYEENSLQYEGYMDINGTTCLVEISTLPMYQSDSRVYICTANDQAYSNIRKILYICFGIVLAAVLLPAIVIYFFTRFFAFRINALRQAMHQASNEDYEIVNSIQGQDEVSEAFSDLETMVQKIKQKDADMYESRINEKELVNEQQVMEYKVLSSQINPHFLYNTLETIRMKAFTAGDREVATAIKLLGKSMRYVLDNTGMSFTTLSRELEHVKTYLAIQELRFEGKFDSRFEIAGDIDSNSVYILPLLLQPIVENAILHGLEEKETGGLIRIVIFKKSEDGQEHSPELLCIDVSDNGCGIEESELLRLGRDIEIRDTGRSKSIGLYNINQRIKLNYGAGYGIRIESVPDKGTTVHLVIPLEYNIDKK